MPCSTLATSRADSAPAAPPAAAHSRARASAGSGARSAASPDTVADTWRGFIAPSAAMSAPDSAPNPGAAIAAARSAGGRNCSSADTRVSATTRRRVFMPPASSATMSSTSCQCSHSRSSAYSCSSASGAAAAPPTRSPAAAAEASAGAAWRMPPAAPPSCSEPDPLTWATPEWWSWVPIASSAPMEAAPPCAPRRSAVPTTGSCSTMGSAAAAAARRRTPPLPALLDGVGASAGCVVGAGHAACGVRRGAWSRHRCGGGMREVRGGRRREHVAATAVRTAAGAPALAAPGRPRPPAADCLTRAFYTEVASTSAKINRARDAYRARGGGFRGSPGLMTQPIISQGRWRATQPKAPSRPGARVLPPPPRSPAAPDAAAAFLPVRRQRLTVRREAVAGGAGWCRAVNTFSATLGFFLHGGGGGGTAVAALKPTEQAGTPRITPSHPPPNCRQTPPPPWPPHAAVAGFV
eukprot:334115-Chlamydomonas_euryale.AAC.6